MPKYRCRVNRHMLEVWDGPPGEAESDLIANIPEDMADDVIRQLSERHKWPKMQNTMVYPIKRGDIDGQI